MLPIDLNVAALAVREYWELSLHKTIILYFSSFGQFTACIFKTICSNYYRKILNLVQMKSKIMLECPAHTISYIRLIS